MENKEEDQKSVKTEELKEVQNKDRLLSNYMLFIIPSWGNLLGHPTNGRYVGQEVDKISSDIVFFFASNELSIKTDKGVIYCLFGLGNYYTKFELQQDVEISRGKYIIDEKLLTGIVLSDFVYDHLASSKNLILEDDPDVIIAEKVIKIPVDLSDKTEGQMTFIKGALMRNVFIPYKEVILKMLDMINKTDSYNIDRTGHMLLSGHGAYFDKILVSEGKKSNLQEEYMNSTAGILEIIPGADKLLTSLLTPVEFQKIKSGLSTLKAIYSNLKFDRSYFYSMLEAIAQKIPPEALPQISLKSSPLAIKQTILYSAEDRINSYLEWPNEFPRKEKETEKVKPTYIYPEMISGTNVANSTTIKEYDTIKEHEELPKEDQFVLRIDKSEKVEKRVLPATPLGEDIEKIFLYLKHVIEEDYDMSSVGTAFGLARDSLPPTFKIENPRYAWEMSKIENLYIKKSDNLGLPAKEKEEILEKINSWLHLIEEEKRKKQEELEAERRWIEAEQKRLEEERLEKERLKKEHQERERLAQEKLRLEEERIEREKLEKIRLQKEQVKKQRELEQIEAQEQERIRKEQEELDRAKKEQEKLEKEREVREQEILEKAKREQEELEKEKAKLKEIKAERKRQEKLLKKKKKEEKKREKERLKIEKQKAKEKEKLEKISKELKSSDS